MQKRRRKEQRHEGADCDWDGVAVAVEPLSRRF